MNVTWPLVEESLVGSRHRRRVLLMLSSLTEAYTGQLAHACHLDRKIVRWIMRGRLPYYSVELSLVALGLAAEVRDHRGARWVITDYGRRIARKISARDLRKGRQAEAVRASNLAFHAARESLQLDSPSSSGAAGAR